MSEHDILRTRLYHSLQRTNKISARILAKTNRESQCVEAVLREAGMVEYLPSARLWAPDVGTYDWLVKQRERLQHERTP